MIRLTLFILTMIGTLFISSPYFVDVWIVPKWLLFFYGLILVVFLSFIHTFIYSFDKLPIYSYTILSPVVVLAILGEVVYGSYIWFIGDFSNPLMGTYDNVAGFAASLCLGVPFCLYEVRRNKGWKCCCFMLILGVISVAMFLSESRAGIISLLVVLLFWLGKSWRASKKTKLIVLTILVSCFITGLYFYKKDSADGRFLIWRCSLEMILDKPLLGWGIGGFEAHYMDYQADFFNLHSNSDYKLLADTIQHPFNEYLSICIAFGIIGFLLICALCFYLLRCYYKQPTKEKECGMLCWITVMVFAFFSYPLMYPFVWLVLLYSAFLLIKDDSKFLMSTFFVKAIVLCSFCLCIMICSNLYRRTKSELEWSTVLKKSVTEKDSVTLERYEQLYDEFKGDRYFLYNYAVILYEQKNYSLGLSIALECRRLWADYDIELLLAELYVKNGKIEEAEICYRKAANMCPNRFMPLYELVLLLDKEERLVEAKALALQIIGKPVKIPSRQVRQIKKKMNDYIIRTENVKFSF